MVKALSSGFCHLPTSATARFPRFPLQHRHVIPNPHLKSKRKALLIGICYPGQHDSAGDSLCLTLPWQDVERLKTLLNEKYGYHNDDIVTMTDRPSTQERFRPTHENITRELQAFLNEQTPKDRYVFYYAGHSYQQDCDDDDTEEPDGKDELILPCDAYDSDGNRDEAKAVLDGFLKEKLVAPLHQDNRLVAIFDSCHSATLLDLPHHKCNRVFSVASRWRRTVRRVLEAFCGLPVVENFLSPRSSQTSSTPSSQSASSPSTSCTGYCRRLKASGNVLCISACKDSQQAYEGEAGTSVTSYIISFLENERNPSLKQLMRVVSAKFQVSSRQMEKEFSDQYEQGERKFGQIAVPQLSSLYPLNMDMSFRF